MELPKHIHGQDHGLLQTLASRVSFIRNSRRIHVEELAVQSRVSLKFVEDIEAGIETWLPVSIRQRIARVLKVDPIILEEVEIKKEFGEPLPKDPPLELVERIKEEILSGDEKLSCPKCSKPLKVWIQDGFDLNGFPIQTPKGHCTVCVFQVR